MSKPKTKYIEIEIIAEYEKDLRQLLKNLSDNKLRKYLFENQIESTHTLQRFLSYLPTNPIIEFHADLIAESILPFQQKGKEVLLKIQEYIYSEKIIIITNENYIPYFLQYISGIRILKYVDKNSAKSFPISFLKTIYNFICWLIPNESDYKKQKLTGYIAKSLGEMNEDETRTSMIDKVKYAIKTEAEDLCLSSPMIDSNNPYKHLLTP